MNKVSEFPHQSLVKIAIPATVPKSIADRSWNEKALDI